MEITPQSISNEEPIILSHFAEYHYGSLKKIDDRKIEDRKRINHTEEYIAGEINEVKEVEEYRS
jgi:hypothetical protein